MKRDYPKIILVGFGLVLFVFLFLLVACAVCLENIGVAALITVLGTVLFAIVYGVLSVKYADKLGAAIVDPKDLKTANGQYECVLCGATTTFDDVFRFDPRSFSRRTGLVCPACFLKRHSSIQKGLGLIYVGIAALGLVLIIANRDSEIGAVLLNMFLFYFFSIVCLIPHELGHAIAAALVGLRVFRISIGFGKTLFTTKLFGWMWEIKAIPASGLVFSSGPSARFFRLRRFVMILAGPLANIVILVALLSCISWDSMFSGFPDRVSPLADLLLANLLILVTGLLPRKVDTSYGRLSSDGLSLLTIPFMKQDKIKESQASYYAVQGAESLREKDLDTAKKWFTKGLAEFPDSILNLNNMGVFWVETGDFEQARRVFERLLQNIDLDPRLRVLVQNNLAYSYAMLGGDFLLNADRLSKEVYDNASWVTPFKGTRGTVLVELGQIDEGIELLKQAMAEQEDPSSKASNAGYLAIALARKGDREQARKYFETAKMLDPSCSLLTRVQNELAKQ